MRSDSSNNAKNNPVDAEQSAIEMSEDFDGVLDDQPPSGLLILLQWLNIKRKAHLYISFFAMFLVRCL